MAEPYAKEDSGTIARIVSRLSSITSLFGWWVGEDEHSRANGIVTVCALTDAISVELPTQQLAPGEQLKACLRDCECSGHFRNL